MPQFSGRLAAIRITPSRSEDADTVARLVIEAHDLRVDELSGLVGGEANTLVVHLNRRPVPATPLEQAIIEAPPPLVGYEDVTEESAEIAAEPSTNGHQEPLLPSNTRRRRGTRADPTEDE